MKNKNSQKEVAYSVTENNKDNNRGRYNNRYNLTQVNLNGELIINNIELCENHRNFLETFYENKNIAISPSILFKAWGNSVHMNTIKNFIKTAITRGWIYELKIIEGTRLSNAYVHFISPDTLITGQVVKDKRYKYYRITKYGIDLWESQ